MPESGTYGSVRGVPSNGHPYRDNNGNDDLLKAAHTGHPGGHTWLAQSDTVGHTVTIGPTRSGKTCVPESPMECRKVKSRAAQMPSVPYYRQFDKRKYSGEIGVLMTRNQKPLATR
jgi:hypothetical protein